MKDGVVMLSNVQEQFLKRSLRHVYDNIERFYETTITGSVPSERIYFFLNDLNQELDEILFTIDKTQ
jgi:hypothetical protein